MVKEITLPHLYEPRDYQIPILEALDGGCKRALWLVHRRGGKDLTIWNWVIKRLQEKKCICFHILPTYSQAKKVIWNSQTKEGIGFLDFIPKELIKKKYESELSIHFKNGSILQLIGSDNVDRLVGTAPNICVFSEAAIQLPNAWDLIRPIMTENDGVAIFITTPRGKNWVYDMYGMAKNNPAWFCEKLSIDDTKAIGKDVVQAEIDAGMSEELAKQEFYVSFIGLEGSYYINYLDDMRRQDRITNVPHDPTARVCTAWDLGINDSTTIIFFQRIGQEIHIIDSYENNGRGLDHYVKLVFEKPYIYEAHYAPHDIENRELGTGISRKELCHTLGIDFITLPTLKTKLLDGIEVARGIFPRMWIDELKNKRLITALENYRKQYDEKHNVFTNYPVHDEYSHFADSFRYMAIACKLYDSKTVGMPVSEIYERNRLNRVRK